MINFGGVPIVITLVPSRIIHFISTLSSVLPNISESVVHVIFNGSKEDFALFGSNDTIKKLFELGRIRNNKISVFNYGLEFSCPANVRIQWIKSNPNYKWCFQLDDDQLFSSRDLDKFSMYSRIFYNSNFDWIILVQYDVINDKGYKDHNKIIYNECTAPELEERLWMHHLWEANSTPIIGYNYGMSIGLLNVASIRNNKSIVKSWEEWPKGKKGYDNDTVRNFDLNVILVRDCTAYHIGTNNNQEYWTK